MVTAAGVGVLWGEHSKNQSLFGSFFNIYFLLRGFLRTHPTTAPVRIFRSSGTAALHSGTRRAPERRREQREVPRTPSVILELFPERCQ